MDGSDEAVGMAVGRPLFLKLRQESQYESGKQYSRGWPYPHRQESWGYQSNSVKGYESSGLSNLMVVQPKQHFIFIKSHPYSRQAGPRRFPKVSFFPYPGSKEALG